MGTIENNNEDLENSFQLMRNNSVQSLFQPVGFGNEKNENNCFVSVVFHTLFHFIELKDYLLKYELTTTCPKLIVELVSLLFSYQKLNKDKNSNGSFLNPSSFRNELANIFKKEKEFQLNEEGDPIELLNFLLNCLHTFIISNGTKIGISENECKKNCLIHELFYINLSEKSKCSKCNKNNNIKYDYNYFMELLNVNSILDNIKELIGFKNIKGNLIIFSRFEVQKCEICKNTLEKSYICKSTGKYFIINLGWNGNISKMEDLCNIYTLIGSEFELKDIYNECDNKNFYFMGMLLYWSNHYICLFYEKKLKNFVMYDDQKIKQFSSWKDLIENLIMGCYQPVALIYGKNDLNINFDITEKFYNNIIKISKEHDKKKKSFGISAVKIKEDEWECEICKNINNNDNDICNKCKKSNPNVAFLLEAKFEALSNIKENELSEEDKKFIERFKKRKKEEEMTEKWICPNCHCKTNLVTNDICSICNYHKKDLNKKNKDDNTIFQIKKKKINKDEKINKVKEDSKNEDEKLKELKIKEQQLNEENEKIKEQKINEENEKIKQQKLKEEQIMYQKRLNEENIKIKDQELNEENEKLKQQKLNEENEKLNQQKLKEKQIIYQQRLNEENEKIKQQKLNEEKLKQQKLEEQRLKQQKLEEQKLKQQKLEEQKLKQQKLEVQKLKQQKLEEQKLKLQKLEEQK